MKKLVFSVLTTFVAFFSFSQTSYYVNDGSLTGDIFTSGVGNDANSGAQSAPLATIAAALTKASAGDIIYVDAGSYSPGNLTISKSIILRGANYLTSPNDPVDPLLSNSARNAETIINNSLFTIAAGDISITGFLFNPGVNNQIIQTNTNQDFDNITISKSIFRNTSGNSPINITGKNITPLVSFNYSIIDNRFIKEVNTPGTSVIVRRVDGIQIQNNTFTVSTPLANGTENAITINQTRSDHVVISQNAVYAYNALFSGVIALNVRIDFNNAVECNRLGVTNASAAEPCIYDISDNIVTNPRGAVPSIGFNRSNGNILTSSNIARIERNTITVNATGTTLTPQALIAPTLDSITMNCQVYIRDNKLKFTGDFSLQDDSTAANAGIRFLNNIRQAIVERNEIEFNASNFKGYNKAGIAVYHYGLSAGTSLDILNNKISGFNTSVLFQQNDPNSATGLGEVGYLPVGVTVNINNNSFTNDVFSINNGTVSANINATCNFYNSNTPEVLITKISPETGDYLPWLVNGTDNEPLTPGFQPVPGSCIGRVTRWYVNDTNTTGDVFTTKAGDDINGRGIANYPFATITNALAQAQPGDSIFVDAGSYTEQVNVNKAITIHGAGMGVTIINGPSTPLAELPSGGGVKAIIQTETGLGLVNVENLTIDGTNSDEQYCLFNQGSGKITDCELRNSLHGFLFRDATGAAQTVSVINNNIHHIGFIGGYFFGNGLNATAIANVIDLTGSVYGMGLIGGDHGTQAAIKSFTATNNAIINHTGYGILINSTQPSTVRNNSITAISGYSIQVDPAVVVDATCNWFGTADANLIIPRVTGTANYSPWLTNGTDNDAAIGFQQVPNSCNGRQNKFYVNDASQTGDVFTQAIGNDGNNGTAAMPFATIAKAYLTAQPGDSIFVDAGTYNAVDGPIGKSITLLGANYLISPNDASNPLNPNNGRVAETIISNTTWVVAASNISIKGFTFDPQTKTALAQTNNTLDFDNIDFSNNIVFVKSGSTAVDLKGKQQLPLVTLNYNFSANRFIKYVNNPGVNISLAGIDGIQITDNTFTVDNSTANWSQIAFKGTGFRNDNFVISHNTAYRTQFTFQNMNAVKAQVSFNKVIETVRFLLDFNGLNIPTEIDINDNDVTIANANGGPALSYSKTNGTDISAPSIARIERNNILVDGTGWPFVPQALIAPTVDNLSGNTEVIIRDNKLKITGNFSAQNDPNNYVSAIRFLNNSRQAIVERNELEFSATNYGTLNKYGIGILYAGLQPGTNFDFFNNKISGFPTSIGIQNQATGNYGELPSGVTVNIHNNSLTGDLMSINNGTTGQDASASCNWYGSAAAQNFINKLANVSAVPWLTNGADDDAATGFQPVPGACDGYPTLIILNGSTNVTCKGAANGTISITTTNGKALFTYTWTKDGDANFVSHEEDPTNLTPGTYHLSVVDGNGSTLYIIDPQADGPGTISVTITEPAELTATTSGTNVTCNGGANGTALVTVDGGTENYTFIWSNAATTQSISQLAAGTYNVTVTDANGCTATSAYEVTQPASITATTNVINNSCFNGSSGSITVTASGGTGTLSYSLDGNVYQTGTLFANLAANSYVVYVKDENACIITTNATVTQPTAIAIAIGTVTSTCAGSNNGSITSNATGGTGILAYAWTGPNGFSKASKNINNLAAGVYTLTVTDANGCNAVKEVTVPALPAVTATANVTDVVCYNTLTGAVDLNPAGGSDTFTFTWSGPNGFKASTEDINNLKAGTYTVTILDAAGCSLSQSYTIKPATAITVNIVKTDITMCGELGAINASVTGGSSPYQYQLNNGPTQNSAVFNNLLAGNYTLNVTDSKGCVSTTAVTITDTGSDPYEVNNKQNSAAPITVNQSVSARIAPTNSDVDWYKFTTASVSGSYTLTLTHPSVNYTFNLYDSKGKIVTANASTATTKTYNSLATGTTYTIQVSGSTASFNCYTLTITSSAVPVAARISPVQQQQMVGVNKLETTVYPNPHQGSFGIRIETAQSGMATVEIMNIAGQRLESRKVAVNRGYNVVPFNNMPRAALLYKVTMGNEVKTGKIISIY